MNDILKQLGEGLHFCGFLNGWIEIEKTMYGWEVMWASGKTTHNPINGPAYSVEFLDNGDIGQVFKSAITMWLVRSQKDKELIVMLMKTKINKAYKKKKLKKREYISKG